MWQQHPLKRQTHVEYNIHRFIIHLYACLYELHVRHHQTHYTLRIMHTYFLLQGHSSSWTRVSIHLILHTSKNNIHFTYTGTYSVVFSLPNITPSSFPSTFSISFNRIYLPIHKIIILHVIFLPWTPQHSKPICTENKLRDTEKFVDQVEFTLVIPAIQRFPSLYALSLGHAVDQQTSVCA